MGLGKGSKGNLHRRARSSVGTNRKASDSREGKYYDNIDDQLLAGNKSQPRGALLNNPAPATDTDEELIEDIDMMPGGSTYLNNHQSQPLSVIGPDN